MLFPTLLAIALAAAPSSLHRDLDSLARARPICDRAIDRLVRQHIDPATVPERRANCQLAALAAGRHGVGIRLAVAVLYVESKMLTNPGVSSAGCVGPMQLAPRWYCDCADRDACDPERCQSRLANIDHGVATVGDLTTRYGRLAGLCLYATGDWVGCRKDPMAFGGPKLYALRALLVRAALISREDRRWGSEPI